MGACASGREVTPAADGGQQSEMLDPACTVSDDASKSAAHDVAALILLIFILLDYL